MNTTTLIAVANETPRIELTTPPRPQPSRVELVDRPELNNSTPPLKAKTKRKPSYKLAALVALTVIAGSGATKLGYDWWTIGRFIESTDDAYIGGDVTVIAPKVAGFIGQLAVVDNQQVHAGDLLIKLDDRDYRASLAKADAAVAMQEAALVNLEATTHLQQAVAAQAQAEINVTDAEIVRTHDDQVRYKKLAETGALSLQDFQKADADYKEAIALGQKAQANLDAAHRQLDVIATQKQQANAALAQTIADQDLARLNLSYTELRAPIDGLIGNRNAQVGAYATTGSQLISLVPARGLWIDANFKESQLEQMHQGSPATVTIDSIAGKKFHGQVASIAPATGAQFSVLPPENATGNFTKIVQRVAVRIVLDDAAVQLRPGLSVTAKVNTHAN